MTSLPIRRSWLWLGVLSVCGPPACADDGRATENTAGGLQDPGAVGSTAALGSAFQGDGTYYAATGAGACLFDPSPGALLVAAVSASHWDGSALCGACADVAGPDGSVRVRIVDLCPDCTPASLDLSPEAFQHIAKLERGRVAIRWQVVACEVEGPVAYRYKDGSNPFWTAVQVHNHRLPISRMEWSKDTTHWEPMPRQDYNYFLAKGGFGEGATQVRITAASGQQLTDTLPPVKANAVVDGRAQFEQ